MMCMKKIRSCRGDTLMEALVGILIVSLVTATLAAMVMTAEKMNRNVKADDESLYGAINALEEGTVRPEPGKLIIKVNGVPMKEPITVQSHKTNRTEGKYLVGYSLN